MKFNEQLVLENQVDSTMAHARRLAEEGGAHGTSVIAREQTAGRGRLGRDWISAPNAGLWATTILRPTQSPQVWPTLSLMGGAALAQCCHALGVKEAGVKWPNDVVVGQKKLAGVLLEAELQKSPNFVLLGVGLNMTLPSTMPDEIARRATALDAFGVRLSLEELAAAWADHLQQAYTQWCTSVESSLETWRALDVLVGQNVSCVLDGRRLEGIAKGINEHGALLLDVAGQTQTIAAADVERLLA